MTTHTRRTRPAKQHRFHVNLWALLTILIFPVVLITTANLGADTVTSFFYSISAALFILLLNWLVERHLWIMDPIWRKRFERPDFSFRLAVVSGAILLIVETLIIVLLFSNRTMDVVITNLILDRECSQPSAEFADLCRKLTNTY